MVFEVGLDDICHKTAPPAAACRIISASRDMILPSPLTSAVASNGRLPTAIWSAIAASAGVMWLSLLRSPFCCVLPAPCVETLVNR